MRGYILSPVFDDFELLARNPGMGHKRQDLTKFPVLFAERFPTNT